MTPSLPNDRSRTRRVGLITAAAVLVAILLCIGSVFLFGQVAPLQQLAGLIPASPRQTPPSPTAISPSDTPTNGSPSVTSTLSPSPTSFPTETPAPTDTTTPTPTFTLSPTFTPTPTLFPTTTPTANPYVSIGDWTVGCHSEIPFPAVSASRVRFEVLSGGGADKTISFNCCGSGGAAFFANGDWVPVTDESLSLHVGDTRETADLGSATVDRERFNVGCNDGEQMDVNVSYLPATQTVTATATITGTLVAPTSTLTPTVSITATATITGALVAPTSTLTPTVSITATATITGALVAPTSTLTPTVSITATATPTATIAPTVTLTVTPTVITQTATLTPTATVTATTVATTTRPLTLTGGIAFHRNDNGIDRAYVYDLTHQNVTPLVDIGPVMDLSLSTSAAFGAWSPDNSRFAYISTVSPGGSNILRVLDWKSSSTRALYSSDTGGGLSSPTWSPDGTRIAFVRLAGNQHLWAVDIVRADGTRCSDKYECELTANANGEQFRGGISWSSQGLFALAFNTTGPNDVYTLFSNGLGLANLTKSTADDTTPAWSPDGKTLAFTSYRDGPAQIYVMNADGTGQRRVSQGGASDFSPSWSQDGGWIAFASTRAGSTDIYVMDVNGGNVTRLTTTGGDHPIWSK